jgi:response regulator RpfG family c-di-GMP phosphodiesterase
MHDMRTGKASSTSLSGLRSLWLDLDDLRFRIDSSNLQVRAEQLRTRMEMYLSLIAVQMVLQPLFVWLLWEQSPHGLLLLWLAVFYGLHAAEFARWVYYRDRLDTIEECRSWHAHFTNFALVAGLLWGAAAAAFYPSDIGYQSLLICVMLGLVAGGLTTNPVHPPTLYGYTLGIMAPLVLRELAEGDEINNILAVMLALFVVIVVVAGNRLSKTFVLSLQQRFENFSLLQQLIAQKAATEQARNQLEKANAALLDHELKLEQMVLERTAELQQQTEEVVAIKDTTIMALTSLAGTRDNETGNHIRRTQNYVRALAKRLRTNPRFSAFLTDENIDLVYKIAPLHDIGKVGIPDYILHKPGKLTAEEFEIMKTHTTLGGNAISGAENMTNVRDSAFLKAARQIAIGHHEKWDGSGYPFGLRGDDIPIVARLMAVADVYDAMACRRVYKPALPHDEVAEFIIRGRGVHFDPDVVDAFVSAMSEFKDIAATYRDDDDSIDSLHRRELGALFQMHEEGRGV